MDWQTDVDRPKGWHEIILQGFLCPSLSELVPGRPSLLTCGMANPASESELIFQGEDTKKCLGLRHGDTDPVSLKIISRGDREGFAQGKR